MSVTDLVNGLVEMVERGEFLESFPLFYSPDAEVQENDQAPRVGLAALIENEKRVLTIFKKVTGRALRTFVDGDHAVIHWSFEFVAPNDAVTMLDELTYQVWENALIVREKFYYDPTQMGGPRKATA